MMLAGSAAHPSTIDAPSVVGSQPIRIPASKQRAAQQRHAATAGDNSPPQSHTPPVEYTGEEEEDEQQVEEAEDEHEHTAFSITLPRPSSPSHSLPLSSIPTIPAPSPSSSSSTSPLSPSLSPPPVPPTTTTSYDAHPEHIGETIANFTLLSVIGRGGYGKVYLAQHDTNRRLYALKVMKKSLLATKNITGAAIQEKHILSLLRHPSLVTLRYAFQSPSKLYLVMDYVAGGELFGRLDGCSGRRMLEREVVFYTAELVVALQWLHERDIIYRDLKPENILLDRRGHVVLSDFGFARSGVVEARQTNSFLGTTHAMSPEMINGSGHGKGTDWWALGVLIVELLTGRPPWQAGNKQKLQEMIVSGPLHLPKYLSIPAKSIIQGLLKRTIDKRLGCGDDGVVAIKSHAFFAGVNWQKVADRKMKPPWVPPLTSDRDVSMFDTQFTSEGVCDSPSSIRGRTAVGDTEEDERVRGFEGFSYTRSPYMGGQSHGQLDRSQEIGVTVGSVSNFLLASPSTTPSQHHSPLMAADTATNRKLMAQRAKEKTREMEEEKEEKERKKESDKERERKREKEEKKMKKAQAAQAADEQQRKEREEEERVRRLEENDFQRKQQEEQQRIKQQQLEEEQRKKAATATTPPPTTPSRPISQLSAQLAQRHATLPSPILSASGAKLAPWAHKAGVATTPPATAVATATGVSPARPITSSISSPAISALYQPTLQPHSHSTAREFAPHIPITARLFPTLEASTQHTRSPSTSLSGATSASGSSSSGTSAAVATPKAKTSWARLF